MVWSLNASRSSSHTPFIPFSLSSNRPDWFLITGSSCEPEMPITQIFPRVQCPMPPPKRGRPWPPNLKPPYFLFFLHLLLCYFFWFAYYLYIDCRLMRAGNILTFYLQSHSKWSINICWMNYLCLFSKAPPALCVFEQPTCKNNFCSRSNIYSKTLNEHLPQVKYLSHL